MERAFGTSEIANRIVNLTGEEADLGIPEIEPEPLPTSMTEEQIEEVTRLLRAGRRLPPHLFPHLFEVPREYELSYRGKARRVDVLADTMAMPIQAVRTFGEPKDGWSNMLILGDNLQVLRHLVNMKAAGDFSNSDGSVGVRLCYIDPPFASEQEFVGSRNEKAYSDRVAGAEFVEHLRRRLILIHELLTDDGSLVVHLDTRKAHYIKVILDEIFGEGNFRNEIIWKRTSAHSGANRFGPVHDTLLFYSRSDSYVWHQQYEDYDQKYLSEFYTHVDADGRRWSRSDLTAAGIRRGETGKVWRDIDVTAKGRHWAFPPSELDQMDAQGLIHWPRRAGAMPRRKLYHDTQPGIPAQDVWTDIRPIHNLAPERCGYPTQKPVDLVKRIIAAASSGGDIVLDAFVGSGTTLIAAQSMTEPRKWIGIDAGKFAIYIAQARLLRAGKKAPEHAFTLYNAGLYDYRALRELPWNRYLDFVLQLFQCRKSAFSFAGVPFHGYIADDPVLVYDFRKHQDGRIGMPFVDDLARLCGRRVGDRCFIIAPASVVDFYEDYVTVKGTRFFFLRIPYSIIAELHKRAFSDLRQPTSEARANAPIDSVGFDFVVPPRVECRYRASKDSLTVEIAAFESEAFSTTESEENIANLAMVLVDYDYEGETFDVNAVHFADDLKKASWRFFIPAKDAGKQILIVYVDLFGNEHRELKRPSDFGIRGRHAAIKKRNTAAARTNRRSRPAKRRVGAKPRTRRRPVR